MEWRLLAVAKKVNFLYIGLKGEALINGDDKYRFNVNVGHSEWKIQDLERAFLGACNEHDFEFPSEQRLSKILREAIRSYQERLELASNNQGPELDTDILDEELIESTEDGNADFSLTDPSSKIEKNTETEKSKQSLSRFHQILQGYEQNVVDELFGCVGVFTSGIDEGTIARPATKQLVDFVIAKTHDPKDFSKIIGHHVKYGRVSLNAIPFGNILCNRDPLTSEKTYTITLQTNEDGVLPEAVGPYSLPELISALEERHFAWKTGTVFQDRIRHMINAYHAEGKIKYVSEIRTGGFYCLDGKTITASQVEVKLPTKSEAREACWVIEEAQKQFYSKARDKLRFSHLVNLASVAPFDFARRQMEGVVERHGYIQSIDMFGESHTGKSTMPRRVCLEMWGKNDQGHFIESNSTVNEARVSGALRDRDTYLVVMDELDYLVHYENKDSIQKVISGLKNSRESTDFRTIRGAGKNKQGAIRQLALALPIITRNSGRISETGFNSRFISDEYKPEDVKKDENEKDRFNAFWDANAPRYRHSGDYFAYYVISHPEVLNQRWTDSTKRLLHELFEYAEMPFPEWLNHTLENTSNADIAEEHVSIIRATFVELIEKAWNANRSDPDVYKTAKLNNPLSEDPLRNLKQIDRFVALVRAEHLHHYFAITLKGRVIIHPSIVTILKGKGIRLGQEAIASLCRFNFSTQRVWDSNSKFINTPVEDFARFLSPEIEEVKPTGDSSQGGGDGGDTKPDSSTAKNVDESTRCDLKSANEAEQPGLLRCRRCKFQNIHKESIEQHMIYSHGKKDLEMLRATDPELSDIDATTQMTRAWPDTYDLETATKIVKEFPK